MEWCWYIPHLVTKSFLTPLLIWSACVMPAPVCDISSRCNFISSCMLDSHKGKHFINHPIHAPKSYAWSLFFILLPQVVFFFAAPFPVAFFTASQAGEYSGCCANRSSHNCWWYSVLGLPPPFTDDTLAPGEGNNPCLIAGSSMIAAMSDQLNFWSSFSQLQRYTVSTLVCSQSHDTHSTTTDPASGAASVSSSSLSEALAAFFLLFFAPTFDLGADLGFLGLVHVITLPLWLAVDLALTMMNDKWKHLGIGATSSSCRSVV